MRNFILVLMVLFLAACGTTDKQAQLTELKKQRDKLNKEITKLEAELSKDSPTTAVAEVLSVGVTDIALQPFSHFVEVQGKLDGDENVGISAKTVGVIKNVNVKQGDAVRANQVLAELDDAIMLQTIKGLETSLNFATEIYNRQKTLWDQKIGSEVQYLSAKNTKEQLEQQIAVMRDQLDLMKIKSPINGTVEELNVRIGQGVSPGLPVIRVVNFATIKVIADVSETYATKIRKGDMVNIYFPDIQKELSSNIDFAANYINPVNRTFQIETRFKPNGFEMKANMICVVKIQDYTSKEAVVIPVSLIQSDLTNTYVLVAVEKDGAWVVEKRVVKQGQNYNGLAEILEGLKAGDKIISVNHQKVREGDIISF